MPAPAAHRSAQEPPKQDTPAGSPEAKGPHRTPSLTANFVRSVRHSGKGSADHHSDGQGTGLYLQVNRSGSKQWVQRIMLDGRRRDVGLGGLRDFSLSEARAAAMRNAAEAEAYRRKVRRGEPAALPAFARPRSRRTRTVAAALAHEGITLEQAWEEQIRECAPGWKNAERDTRSWRADLKHHLHALAGLPVQAVTVTALRNALAPLTPPTAAKVLQRTSSVLKLALAEGHVKTNVARELAETRRGRSRGGERQHHKALPYADLPAFFATLRDHGTTGAAGALALVLLTALRSNEGSGGRWEEIDLEARVWAVPCARMKGKDSRPFRVPLSTTAMAVLEAAGPRASGLVFRAPRGGPIGDKALRKVMADLRTDATVHGTARSSFRDWCGERGVAREVAEGCLGHKVGSAVERAYARSDLLERRREVMQSWGDFLTGAA